VNRVPAGSEIEKREREWGPLNYRLLSLFGLPEKRKRRRIGKRERRREEGGGSVRPLTDQAGILSLNRRKNYG
jgi:hypothetical protein